MRKLPLACGLTLLWIWSLVQAAPDDAPSAITYSIDVADPQSPAPGSGFWYLVKRHNSCDPGTYGTSSSGAPRVISICP